MKKGRKKAGIVCILGGALKSAYSLDLHCRGQISVDWDFPVESSISIVDPTVHLKNTARIDDSSTLYFAIAGYKARRIRHHIYNYI